MGKEGGYLSKFKVGEEKRLPLPIQDEERCGISLMFRDMYNAAILDNKKKYKIKRFYKIKVNDKNYEWAYGGCNYDGEYNWRMFIFDDKGKKIYNKEPIKIGDFNANDIRDIINTNGL